MAMTLQEIKNKLTIIPVMQKIGQKLLASAEDLLGW